MVSFETKMVSMRCKERTRERTSSSEEDGVLMVGVDKVFHDLDGIVPGEDVVKVTDEIVCVTGVVDSGALDHDEEALLRVLGGELEGLESGGSHLGERRLNGGVSVDLVTGRAEGEDQSTASNGMEKGRESRRGDSRHVSGSDET
jgi:hypothetical protein